jgi:hypothetical protein
VGLGALCNHLDTILFLLGRESIWGVGTIQLGTAVGRYGMPALYLLLIVLAASWVAQEELTNVRKHA